MTLSQQRGEIRRLRRHFEAAYPKEAQLIATPKGAGQMLRHYYGGASDTDEDQYEQF